MGTIRFYKVSEPYGEFSNFVPYPIHVDGKQWPTSEHYFQAQKFAGMRHEEAVRKAKSPMIAARIGRDRTRGLRPDWEKVKDGIMLNAVRAKFNQHPRLASLLLSTGTAELVEHTGKGAYWGDGGDGCGKNMLGKILMQIRDELRQEIAMR
ncbi:MAG: NADAR family protein [Blastocatellia bacterium]